MATNGDETGSDRALVSRGSTTVAPPRGRPIGVGIAAGGVGVGLGAIGAVAAGWAGWSAFAAILTLVANVAMAGAAVAAFGLWQKQVRGAKDYETAIKVLRSVLAAATLAKRSIRSPGDQGLHRDLEEANDAVSESIIDVRVLDEAEAPVVSAVWHLVRDWLAAARDEADVVPKARGWDWSALRAGDAAAARAFRDALDEKVTNVRSWAEPYVGRR